MSKKFLAAVAAVAMAGLIYPQAYIVTDVNYETDVVEITSPTGFTYEFTGTEDWTVGDLCACLMYSNYTTNITDDTIITVRYAGSTEMFDEVLAD